MTMLKILKSGNFGHPVIGKPHVVCVEGVVRRDFDRELVTSLIECGWAELSLSKESQTGSSDYVASEDDSVVVEAPTAIVVTSEMGTIVVDKDGEVSINGDVSVDGKIEEVVKPVKKKRGRKKK